MSMGMEAHMQTHYYKTQPGHALIYVAFCRHPKGQQKAETGMSTREQMSDYARKTVTNSVNPSSGD